MKNIKSKGLEAVQEDVGNRLEIRRGRGGGNKLEAMPEYTV